MFNPISTYRIQFHKDFTFKHLKKIIPYLQQLGIKTLYASPIFEATPGSMHGYDVVNPLKINPEIGTLDELREVSKTLQELQINWLQDIVPNHMAFHPNNNWLMDVLKNGDASAYAPYFDIEWNSSLKDKRIMVPFLGTSFDEAVDQKQIRFVVNSGELKLAYYDQQYPATVDDRPKFTAKFIDQVNNDAKLIKDIAARQAYRLCLWQETDKQINYRRFFTVNGLICLNMQDETVFDAYHELIKQLIQEGIFQGLRVDHIDGLADPESYLHKLRNLAGPDVYIVIEKILEENEALPNDWPVQGTTGYDFLAQLNNLYTETKNRRIFTANYQQLTGNTKQPEKSVSEKKAYILKHHMAGELENLYQLFLRSNLVTAKELKQINSHLKEAIAQFLIHCPVYRYYGRHMPLAEAEAQAIAKLIDGITLANPALAVLKRIFTEQPDKENKDYNSRALVFYRRCMQFTGPLMAKGIEDTLMYTSNRFIGHNEVGDSPFAFGLTHDQFHQLMCDRQAQWPLALNATSTHDTKRGEDVRARLNVLTDIPADWFGFLESLPKPAEIDKNDAYFIYQSIIGAHPMPQTEDDSFTTRLQDYLLKALREGKERSHWAAPNENYETTVKDFICDLLADKSDFRKNFMAFHERVSDFGIINSLSQVLLKFTCPGVPDVYQGADLWDLSLVDPDNRRPVDYQSRQSYSAGETRHDINSWRHLWDERYTGKIKLHLTQRLLTIRANQAALFTQGDYVPLKTVGKYKDNIFAFARQFGNSWYMVTVPLHMATLGADGKDPLKFDWADTAISLPETAPRGWKNLLTGTEGYATESIEIKTLFKGLPLALLQFEQPADRGAGLLLHITSLPSAFGLGDMGPAAHQFIDFLFNSGQRYWQILPLNPVDRGTGYSPYSSTSAMAGNVLLISPELLVADGWLNDEEIRSSKLTVTQQADFEQAVVLKSKLFIKAYQRFKQGNTEVQHEFEVFKSTEVKWLDDFALYRVLKQANAQKPWYEWPEDHRNRNSKSLQNARVRYAEEIDLEKWQQYIFTKQWHTLHSQAKRKGISLVGDLPFYISYDSADVWANPQLFKLDHKGNIAGVAGVPPDYFSAEGQLWGMPVYNWEAHHQDGYRWWLQRIRKNLEYVDLIRLDHFRAFVNYWEVPGNEHTAINGKWMPGPGAKLFDAFKAELGNLPFVAEDLGDIDALVYSLRDQFELPGMRVLQFAFGDNMPVSPHIPHYFTPNSFAYTGTHDNNTIKGWYATDLDIDDKHAIDRYTGQKTSAKNICDIMIRLCYASVARVAILPMQDALELGGEHRMNLPSSTDGNWTWRLTEKQLNKQLSVRLRDLARWYNR